MRAHTTVNSDMDIKGISGVVVKILKKARYELHENNIYPIEHHILSQAV